MRTTKYHATQKTYQRVTPEEDDDVIIRKGYSRTQKTFVFLRKFFVLSDPCGEIAPPTARHDRHGFTLVELIVVIVILAVLGTIGFVSLDRYTAASRDAVRIEDLGNIRK